MFVDFFYELKDGGLPVTLKEYLTLLEAVKAGCAAYKVEDFYYLSRSVFVKDEKNLDKFDRIFGKVFEGIEFIGDDETVDLPEEWLK